MQALQAAFIGFVFLLLPQIGFAQSNSILWPSRHSQVICGVMVDGESLSMRMVLPNELLAAETENGRTLVYMDFHKPGQVHWVFTDGLSDEDFAQREVALAKLSPEEAAMIRKATASRQTEMYMGMAEGYVHMRTTFGERELSMSCQEISSIVSQ